VPRAVAQGKWVDRLISQAALQAKADPGLRRASLVGRTAASLPSPHAQDDNAKHRQECLCHDR